MFVQNFSPWIGEEAIWGALVNELTPRLWEKNQVLFHQGDSAHFVYVVESGRICITSFQENGTEQQIMIAERGAMFGEDSCLAGLPYLTTAVSIVDSMVYTVPFAWLEKQVDQSVQLRWQVLKSINRKNLVLLHRVMEFSSADAFQRIAQVLVNLSQRYGEVGRQGIQICIRFTHQDVANLIHVSRVTVNNVFQVLMKQKIIEKRRGRIWIIKNELLLLIAKGDIQRHRLESTNRSYPEP